MALTDPEQLLLDTLKALPPNTVYSDAGRKTIFRGFQLYTDRRVTAIAWNQDKGVLVAKVMDRTLLPVRIFLDGSRLIFRCACRDLPPDEKCEHVLCVLLMIIHLLKPHLFKMTAENSHYRDRLMGGLLKEPGREDTNGIPDGKVIPFTLLRKVRREFPVSAQSDDGMRGKPLFQIVLQEAGNGLKAHVEKDSRRIEPSADRHHLPEGIDYLINFANREDVSVALSVFLLRWGNQYPLFYREGNKTSKVKWLNSASCATWTEFDVSGDEILARKGCDVGKDRAPADAVGDFAFNRERTRMFYVPDRRGWGLWETMRHACARDPRIAPHVRQTGGSTIHIPKEVFRGLQVSFERPNDGGTIPFVVFKAAGVVVEPLVSAASGYRLTIAKGHEGRKEFRIIPRCREGAYFFQPSKNIMVFVKAVEWGRVPLFLRTRKRKSILFDAFFQALLTKGRKALDKELKRAINEDTFGRAKFATRARRIIRESIADRTGRDMALHCPDDQWRFISVDREKEARLFLIPYSFFGPDLFARVILSDEEMVVGEGELFTHLYALHAMAKEQGIELYLEGQPVESATWECELDATDGTIDWFEIRPEIRCNGQAIGIDLWKQALARKGVVYENGSLKVLDEKTLRTLSEIARFADVAKTGPKEIVSIPRLRIIELFALRNQGIAVKLTARDEEIVARLTRFDGIEERQIPEGLKAELRQYQKEGYYWLSFLYEHRFGACLADDMGVGKTIQALTLLAALKEGKVASYRPAPGPSLIVVPPSLIFNWEQEIEKFYEDLKVYVYRGRDRSTNLEGYDVILTSYGLVRRDIGKLKDIQFNVVIFDEAQTIKNILAGTTGAVRQLKGFFKMALTGTPVENHIGEYYSIMDLVLPGLLGEYGLFQGLAKRDISSFLPLVAERTKPFVLRRTKERILKELPPKVERDIYLELTEKQKRFYNRTVEEVKSTIDEAYRNRTGSQAKIIALTAIMKLRQICLTPQLLVPALREVSPKIEFITDKLEELCSESHSSLVFSQFTSFLDLVEGELRSKNFRIFRLDGSTPVVRRKDIVEGFQGCEDPAVFLLSLKAGGQGLNLTRADYVFHLDPWWNPAVENQASDRTHRIGQKNKVIVTRLLMRHTVEEKMVALKLRKLSLYRALMDAPERSAGRSITREDFNFLLGLD